MYEHTPFCLDLQSFATKVRLWHTKVYPCIDDNRYVITSLIQCQPDTPRLLPVDGEVDIFALQEKVIESIVQSSIEQVAVEEAPKQLDPIQQRIATVLHGYSNSPAVSRKEVIAAIQQLNTPLPGVYVKTLRKAYETFTSNAQVEELLAAVQNISLERERPAGIASENKTPVRSRGFEAHLL